MIQYSKLLYSIWQNNIIILEKLLTALVWDIDNLSVHAFLWIEWGGPVEGSKTTSCWWPYQETSISGVKRRYLPVMVLDLTQIIPGGIAGKQHEERCPWKYEPKSVILRLIKNRV